MFIIKGLILLIGSASKSNFWQYFNCVIYGNLIGFEIGEKVFQGLILLIWFPNNKYPPLILKTTWGVYYLGGLVLGGKDYPSRAIYKHGWATHIDFLHESQILNHSGSSDRLARSGGKSNSSMSACGGWEHLGCLYGFLYINILFLKSNVFKMLGPKVCMGIRSICCAFMCFPFSLQKRALWELGFWACVKMPNLA